ncbi:hypothetical protein DSECCO2_465080 [anaerobic digester metagenome]
MALGDLAERREARHLGVREDRSGALSPGEVDDRCPVLPFRHDHDLFLGDQAVDHPFCAQVKDIVVGRDAARDDGFSKPPGTLDDRQGFAGDRVGGEHDAGLLRPDELLHDDGDVHAPVVEPLFGPVVDGTRAIQGGPAPVDCVDKVFVAKNIEKSLLLAGKTGFRQVFGGGARTDGDNHSVRPHPGVCVGDLLAEVVGDIDAQDEILHVTGDRLQRTVVVDVEARQTPEERLLDPGLDKELSERLRGHHKRLRHGEADCRHLTKRGSLSTYRGDIFLFYFFEPQNVGHFLHSRTTHILLTIT